MGRYLLQPRLNTLLLIWLVIAAGVNSHRSLRGNPGRPGNDPRIQWRTTCGKPDIHPDTLVKRVRFSRAVYVCPPRLKFPNGRSVAVRICGNGRQWNKPVPICSLLGQWTEWSACVVMTCTQSRTRTCINDCGTAALYESRDCTLAPLCPDPCISSCSGKTDGDYQSCNGCEVYASCSNGNLIDNRPCPPGQDYWDDVSKTCEATTTTCIVRE